MTASIAKKIFILAAMQVALLGISFAVLPSAVSADPPKADDTPCKTDPKSQACKDAKNQKGIDCTKVACSDPAADPSATCNNNGCDFIASYIITLIKVLSAVIGLVAAISLIMGGVQYSAAAGDPQKITAAKDRISKTIIALVAYMFLFAFLQFIIPGGAFR